MEKAGSGSFGGTTRKTAEDEGRRRGRLGYDAKQIQKCRHARRARRVEVDQLAYYTGVEVRVPYIPINVLSDVGTHGRFQVM
jgi:hypothetical protein